VFVAEVVGRCIQSKSITHMTTLFHCLASASSLPCSIPTSKLVCSTQGEVACVEDLGFSSALHAGFGESIAVRCKTVAVKVAVVFMVAVGAVVGVNLVNIGVEGIETDARSWAGSMSIMLAWRGVLGRARERSGGPLCFAARSHHDEGWW
jgi:hypothetical protein